MKNFDKNLQKEMQVMRYGKRKCMCFLYTLIATVIFISTGILLVVYRTLIYEKIKEGTLMLKPDTKVFNIFKRTPFDVYFDFYFFNWTNPEEFYDLNKKPRVKEIGPFRFLEVIDKTNITFHDNNSTLSYNRTRRWYFEREGSYHDLHTPITTIDPVAVSAAYTLRYENFFIRKGFSLSLSALKGQIHITKSVGQMLFEGYNDPLVTIAEGMPFLIKASLPFDKFGWFYLRNESQTFDGRFNVGTGEFPSNLGEMYSWNNWEHTPYYEDTCGDIKGSSGELMPQNLPKSPLSIFNTEICRTLVMDYDGEHSRDKFNTYKFVIGDRFFDNGTKFPENRCYCTGECVPYGAINISLCRYNTPAFVSLPHFYKADPDYTSRIDGLEPTAEKHDFYMFIEPTTGIPIEVSARFQLNLLVKEVPAISMLENIKEVFFPVVWFEQQVTMPNGFSYPLWVFLNLKEICLGFGICLMSIGVLMLFIVANKIYTMKFNRSEMKKSFFNGELVPLNDGKPR